MSATVALVDDHELARASLRTLLSGEPGLEVVGEASNGGEALALCRRIRPDLVVLDMHMPDMDGLTVTRAIKQSSPNTRVILFTMHDNPNYLLEALKSGAAGYVLKGTPRRSVLTAVRQSLAQKPILQLELVARAVGLLAVHFDAPGIALSEPLTKRQCEVADLLAKGQTIRAIGRTLHITAGSVRKEVEHILAKLGVPVRPLAADETKDGRAG